MKCLLGYLVLGVGCLAVFTARGQEHDDFFGNDVDVIDQDESFRPSSTISQSTSTSTSTGVHTDFFGQNIDQIQSDENFHPSSAVSASPSPKASAASTPSQSSVSALNHGPLQYFERLIVVHGVLSTVAFLVVLPAGIYLARFTRTFNNKWYTGHWVIQGIAGI